MNLLLTRDTLKFAAGLGIDMPKGKTKKVSRIEKIKVPMAPYVAKDGKTYDFRWGEKTVVADVPIDEDVVRVIPPHLLATLPRLVTETGSQAPIVSFDYFITRALDTLEEEELFKTLYSGLYIKFANIPQNSKVGTDEDNLFEQLGVGNVKGKITAAKVFDTLRSDAKVAIFESDITKRPRQVAIIPTLAGHVTKGKSFISITGDPFRKNIDIGRHAVLNLLQLKVDGKEVIFIKTNGFHGFAAINGAGKVVNQVPDTITSDHEIPPGYAMVLRATHFLHSLSRKEQWLATAPQ